MEQNERQLKEKANFVKALLKSGGLDVVSPPELSMQAIRALGLDKNDYFDSIDNELSLSKNRKEKLNIISALALTHLTPSQMLDLVDTVQTGAKVILEYVHNHPEFREQQGGLKDILSNFLKIVEDEE